MQAILVSQVFVFLKMNIIMLIYLTKPFVFSFQVQDYQKSLTICLFTFNFYHARIFRLIDCALSRDQAQNPSNSSVT